MRRDGASVSLPIDQLAPGDIAELIAGDLVPADARLLESRDLFVNQDADGREQPLGAQGYRALGIASRAVDASHQTAAITDESDLVFSGFAVFLDPPKASAEATIQAMTAAGSR